MRQKFFAILCLLPLAACATVDVADMTAAQRSASLQQSESQNVVIRATNKLYSAFQSNGWVDGAGNQLAKVSQVLLKGQAESSAVNTGYGLQAQSLTDIRRDIHSASLYVRQTKKAADIYLEVTPYSEDLSEELQSLEKALSACHQAENTLKTALTQVPALDIDQELASMDMELAALREVTDLYGERVRARAASIGRAAAS